MSLSSSLPLAFATPFFRNSLILLLGGIGLYRYSVLHADPHPSRASSSGHSAPGNESEDDHHDQIQGDNRPFITRYIEHWSTPSDFWKERNLRHLDLVREQAEDKLLFQDAERPPVHRMRYPQ